MAAPPVLDQIKDTVLSQLASPALLVMLAKMKVFHYRRMNQKLRHRTLEAATLLLLNQAIPQPRTAGDPGISSAATTNKLVTKVLDTNNLVDTPDTTQQVGSSQEDTSRAIRVPGSNPASSKAAKPLQADSEGTADSVDCPVLLTIVGATEPDQLDLPGVPEDRWWLLLART